VNTLYCLEEWRGEQGITSPLGDNFTPGGQSLPLGVKLRMGLRPTGLWKVFYYKDFLKSDTLPETKLRSRVRIQKHVRSYDIVNYYRKLTVTAGI
jgi:hypothetical protein